MKEIKACPFCGNNELCLHEWIFGAKVICRECKTNGPEFTDGGSLGVNASGAWNLWNSRVNQSIAVEAELREDLAKCKAESDSHASSATILGFECQKLQHEIKTLNEEINNLCARLSAFTDL